MDLLEKLPISVKAALRWTLLALARVALRRVWPFARWGLSGLAMVHMAAT